MPYPLTRYLALGHDPDDLADELPGVDLLGYSGDTSDIDLHLGAVFDRVSAGDLAGAQQALRAARGLIAVLLWRERPRMAEDARRADGEALAEQYAHAMEVVR
jgi:hypothetical protein